MPLLDIQELSVDFHTDRGTVHAVRQLSLSLERGEILALVGESGCGKTVLCKSLLGLLPARGRLTGGRILLEGRDLAACTEREWNRIRGRELSMVLQDPMTSLDPTVPAGRMVADAARMHRRLGRREARALAEEALRRVGLSAGQYGQYPGQLSGGMRQRAVLAAALVQRPRILIADEPTTALDVTVQAEILALLKGLRKETGAAVLFVTHDLGVAAAMADRMAVMYAGRVVELGTAEEVFYDPRHPYTWGLLASLPGASGERRLFSIPGAPPELSGEVRGDPFAPRNPYALNIDFEEEPPLMKVGGSHYAATWLLHPDAPEFPPPVRVENGRVLVEKGLQTGTGLL